MISSRLFFVPHSKGSRIDLCLGDEITDVEEVMGVIDIHEK